MDENAVRNFLAPLKVWGAQEDELRRKLAEFVEQAGSDEPIKFDPPHQGMLEFLLKNFEGDEQAEWEWACENLGAKWSTGWYHISDVPNPEMWAAVFGGDKGPLVLVAVGAVWPGAELPVFMGRLLLGEGIEQ